MSTGSTMSLTMLSPRLASTALDSLSESGPSLDEAAGRAEPPGNARRCVLVSSRIRLASDHAASFVFRIQLRGRADLPGLQVELQVNRQRLLERYLARFQF